MIELEINSRKVSLDVEADTPLLWALRNNLAMCGTKYGCGMALCGACTVHVDGIPARSCVLPIGGLQSKKVTTIEGVAGREADAVRAAWIALDVVQCGYCQPGQIMAAVALLRGNQNPSDADIDEAMSGNLCRCGTYPRIRAAVHQAAKALAR